MEPDTHHSFIPWTQHLPDVTLRCRGSSSKLIFGHGASFSSVFVVCVCSSCEQRPLRGCRSGGCIFSLSEWAEHNGAKPEEVQVVQPHSGDKAPLLCWLSAESKRMGGDLLRRRQINIFYWNGNLSEAVAEKLAPTGPSSLPTAYAGFGNWRAATIRGYDPETCRFELKYHDEPKRSQAHIWLPFAVLHYARNPPATAASVRSSPDLSSPTLPPLLAPPLMDSMAAYQLMMQQQGPHTQDPQQQWLPPAQPQPAQASSSLASGPLLPGADSCHSACSTEPVSPPPPPQHHHYQADSTAGYTALPQDCTPTPSAYLTSFQGCGGGNSGWGLMAASTKTVRQMSGVETATTPNNAGYIHYNTGCGRSPQESSVAITTLHRAQSSALLDTWLALPTLENATLLAAAGSAAAPTSSHGSNASASPSVRPFCAASFGDACGSASGSPCSGGNGGYSRSSSSFIYDKASYTGSATPSAIASPNAPGSVRSGSSSVCGSPHWLLPAASVDTPAAAAAAAAIHVGGGGGAAEEDWAMEVREGGAQDEFGCIAEQLLSDLCEDEHDLWPTGMFHNATSTPAPTAETCPAPAAAATAAAAPAQAASLYAPSAFAVQQPSDLPYLQLDWLAPCWMAHSPAERNPEGHLGHLAHPCEEEPLLPAAASRQQLQQPLQQPQRQLKQGRKNVPQAQAGRRRVKRLAKSVSNTSQGARMDGGLQPGAQVPGAPQEEAEDAALMALLREWSEQEDSGEDCCWVEAPAAKRRLLCSPLGA